MAVGESVKVGRREQRGCWSRRRYGRRSIKGQALSSRVVYDWRREMSLCGRRQCGGDRGRSVGCYLDKDGTVCGLGSS